MRVLISVFMVSVKRQVEPERGAARQQPAGFVEQSSDEDYVDDDGEDYDSGGDLDSGDSDYTWSVMTFLRIVITLKIDAGA